MSRFLISDESEGEQTEEEETQEENPTEDQRVTKAQSKAAAIVDNSWKEAGKKRRFRSEKAKRWSELRAILNEILDKLEVRDAKAGFGSFQKLQKAYEKAQKAITEHGHPNFFITNVKEVVDKINEGLASPDAKDYRRWAQELKSFTEPFDELIKECRENPDDFEDDDLDDMDEGEDENEDEDNDIGGGGWFINNDEQEAAEQVHKAKEDAKPKTSKRKTDMSHADAATARLEALSSKPIDNESAKAELEKYRASRAKGKVTAMTARLKQLMEAGLDEKLDKEIQIEIAQTLILSGTDGPVSIDDWNLALTILKELKDEATVAVPLLERLDKDFWARSVDPKHLFTPDVTKLHALQNPSYIPILKEYSTLLYTRATEDEKKAATEKDKAQLMADSHRNYTLYVRVELLLLKHLYHPTGKKEEEAKEKEEKQTVMQMSVKILDVISKHQVFDEEVTLRYKFRVALFLATNLAVRSEGISDLMAAVSIMSKLPKIPETMPLERILYNRAKVYIGTTAFRLGNYRLCYESLRHFDTERDARNMFGSSIPLLLGQAGQRDRCVYPPWMYLDPELIIAFLFLSAVILDLPNLLFGVTEQDRSAIVGKKYHKKLLRLQVHCHPEDIEQRIACCIANAKIGEWQKAINNIQGELDKYLSEEEANRFKSDLTKMSLCCFLLAANRFYDTISYEFLAMKFSMPVDEVKKIAQGLMKSEAPVEHVKASLPPEVQSDGQYISFGRPSIESSLVDYQQEIEKKMVGIEKANSELKPK